MEDAVNDIFDIRLSPTFYIIDSEKKIIDIEDTLEENNKTKEDNRELESIFDGLDCNEKYVTYKVHIMNENDTIESILKNYEIKKSLLEDYNNLIDIKIGDKIIIPTND